MRRESIKEYITKNISQFYGVEADRLEVKILEENSLDEMMLEMTEGKVVGEQPTRKETIEHHMRCPMTELAKQRIQKNSRHCNVYQYNLNGELVNVWNSVREAARTLNYNCSFLSKCCRGIKRSGYGYVWSYAPLFREDKKIVVQVKAIVKNKATNLHKGEITK